MSHAPPNTPTDPAPFLYRFEVVSMNQEKDAVNAELNRLCGEQGGGWWIDHTHLVVIPPAPSVVPGQRPQLSHNLAIILARPHPALAAVYAPEKPSGSCASAIVLPEAQPAETVPLVGIG